MGPPGAVGFPVDGMDDVLDGPSGKEKLSKTGSYVAVADTTQDRDSVLKLASG